MIEYVQASKSKKKLRLASFYGGIEYRHSHGLMQKTVWDGNSNEDNPRITKKRDTLSPSNFVIQNRLISPKAYKRLYKRNTS